MIKDTTSTKSKTLWSVGCSVIMFDKKVILITGN